jgi:hypothetical protein
MQVLLALFKVNIDKKTEATSVRLQHALLLYQVQLIKDDSGCENLSSALIC